MASDRELRRLLMAVATASRGIHGHRIWEDVEAQIRAVESYVGDLMRQGSDALDILAEQAEKLAIYHEGKAGADFRSLAQFARKYAAVPPPAQASPPKPKRNLSTPEARDFWASAERAAAEVETWPAWKRAGINEAATREPGVKVNLLAPGPSLPPTAAAVDPLAAIAAMPPEEIARHLREALPAAPDPEVDRVRQQFIDGQHARANPLDFIGVAVVPGGAPIVRADWICEAGTKACPGNQGTLAKGWICTYCGRKAHAPATWREKGLAAKPKTYEPSNGGEG